MIRFIPYTLGPAQFKEWDPIYLKVAQQVVQALKHPQYDYLHFGSTSFGAAGKGIIDISLLYPRGSLDSAVDFVRAKGFANQHSANPFPPSRPRFDIGVDVFEQTFMLHLHLIEQDSAEHQAQIDYKNIMNNDTELRQQYEQQKQAIIANGIIEQDSYSKRKGVFVKKILSDR